MLHVSSASLRLFSLAAFVVSTVPVAVAAGQSTADGTLIIKGPDGPLSVKLTHAYYIAGADRFDESKTIRSIVFTAGDQRARIEACGDMNCAGLSSVDGLRVELEATGMLNWWAHVAPMQYASSDSSAMKLDTDTPGHVAGTFKLGDSAHSDVNVNVTFDASLVKSFPAKK